MGKTLLMMFCAFATNFASAQTLEFRKAKFHTGDVKESMQAGYDDSAWQTLRLDRTWDEQGISNNRSYAWYRVVFRAPKSMLEQATQKKTVEIALSQVDDTDEAYLNGKLIGKTGRMPGDEGGYRSAWSAQRVYNVDASGIKWDEDNVLAVRVYNEGEPGGLFGGGITIKVPSQEDGLTVGFSEESSTQDKDAVCTISLGNIYSLPQKGTFLVEVTDPETGNVLGSVSKKLSIAKGKVQTLKVPFDDRRMTRIRLTYTSNRGVDVVRTFSPKYILTPAAPAAPRFNTTDLYGVRPGSPIHFRFGISGERPMKVSSPDLPQGLSINPDNGALSGSLAKAGSYTFTVVAENAKGRAEQRFTIRCGSKIALTPPMGWNSWNCWGLSVTQDKVVSSAKALIDKGLADYGYAYMNIDDGWEAPQRNADGTIAVNEKFPDMKGLGDWLHSEGLKFGIYSSPGDLTCGGYLGSLDHERQDAESYNSWGVDYLKYDWCGYGRKHAKEVDNQTVASFVRPYLLMEKCLRDQPRDIFYSLCQYGMADVWKWGEAVDANSWRTTGDITDTWSSLYSIGFRQQTELYPYAKPGHWNDPDMLIVGKVGWSNNLRDSRLTADEQYTHITLWSLLAANMLIGCDIAQIDDFTIALLCNHEVNAVNQDILGKQARKLVDDDGLQIWMRPLADGGHAIGIFNLNGEDVKVDFSKYVPLLGLKAISSIRDLWRQQDLSVTDRAYFIPSHGVKFLKVRE